MRAAHACLHSLYHRKMVREQVRLRLSGFVRADCMYGNTYA
jgi:hypothetical protein